MLEMHFQIFLYLDTYECSKHGGKFFFFLMFIWPRKSLHIRCP